MRATSVALREHPSFTTMLARHQQVHQQYLVQHIYGSSPTYLQQIGSLSRQLLTNTTALTDEVMSSIEETLLL